MYDQLNKRTGHVRSSEKSDLIREEINFPRKNYRRP